MKLQNVLGKGLLAAMLMASLCVLGAQEAQAAKVIRFAFEGSKTTPYAKATEVFKKEVEARTGGSVKVNIFFGGSLAGGSEAIQMVKMGNCEMYMDVTAPIGTFMFPKLTVFDVPYLFRDMEHQMAVLRSPIAAKLAEEMVEATGVRILGYFPAHFRAIAATKDIKTPADMNGFKIRSVQSAMDVATWKRLGAQPVTLPWGEIYTSLATNLIGGLAAAPSSLLSGKFSEVCKFMILTNHQSFIELYIINEAFYSTLSGAEQQALQEATQEAIKFFIKAGIDYTGDFPNPLDLATKAGMQIVEPDRAAFAAALNGLADEFIPKDFPRDLYESIKNYSN